MTHNQTCVQIYNTTQYTTTCLWIFTIYHIQNSVNRIVSLKEFAEFCCVDFKSILKHCETRWLSLRRAINRTLEMWDPLLSYFTSHVDVEKPCKVRTIFSLMSKPTTKVWLLFLSNVLAVFDRFNTFFQNCLVSTAHNLYGESIRLLKTVLGFFIKPDYDSTFRWLNKTKVYRSLHSPSSWRNMLEIVRLPCWMWTNGWILQGCSINVLHRNNCKTLTLNPTYFIFWPS